MNADALLFDFGGTLDTDGVHWSEKYWDFYALSGLGLEKGEFEQAFVEGDRRLAGEGPLAGVGLGYIIARQVRGQVAVLSQAHPELAEAGDRIAALQAAVYADVRATLARALSVLSELHVRHRLGVVSNFCGNLAEVLDESGLAPLIEVVIDSSRVGVAKPDPEIFLLATRRLGLAPARCAVIGDSYERDILPAKACGCQAIWLKNRSWRAPAEGARADAVISTLADLPRCLRAGA